MDLEALCDFCNSLDFGVVGFCGSDLSDRHVDEELALDKVFQNSEQCFICRKIAELFREWEHRRFDMALDLENARASFSTSSIGSLEFDNEGWPKGHLIRFNVLVNVKKPPPSNGYFGPSVEFQKCSQHPLTVRNICNEDSLFDWENGQEEAYSGRIRPLEADTRLFCKWKESCSSIHGDDCNLTFTGKRLPRLRLIDVENMCVVDSEDDSSYTALSYVWGGATLPLLTEFTEIALRKQGSLNTMTLPSTIHDAIELTRRLGEKYIWIDCLCIKQGDEADKLEFIYHMDSIFSFACVTIVAASGVNVETGLPGMKPKSRTREQIPFMIKGVSLIATLDPEGSGEASSYVGDAAWCRRGWTFQEKLFSRRALIFTPEQVYWECQRASWCEDGLWETVNSPTIYRHSFDDQDFRQPWGTDVDSFERVYRKLVDEYSARKLTHEDDGLNAFAGILHHFERQAGQAFLWALPVSFLGTSLTWPCTPSAHRRLDRPKDGTTTPKYPFPSWAWVGWVGRIYYTELFDKLNKPETVDLVFYRLDENGVPRELKTDPQTHNNERDDHWTLDWKDHLRMKVRSEDIPECVRKRSNASHILCFWSSTAFLHVRYEVGDENPSLSCNGKDVPRFWSHVPLVNPGDESELAEFIVIGRENGVRLGNYLAPTLAVVIVSWEDGVAYRRGLVNIKISDWVALVDNRVWKLISLG